METYDPRFDEEEARVRAEVKAFETYFESPTRGECEPPPTRYIVPTPFNATRCDEADDILF